ncbi:DUF4124 domain-containing protein [Microbulbifer aestuariivivens]
MKKHDGRRGALLFTLMGLLLAGAALAGGDGADEPSSGGSVVYKTVAPDGSVVFSDTPPPDGKAERIVLAPTNIQPVVQSRPMPTRKLSPRDGDNEKPWRLASFAIVSPENGATIPPGQRFVVMQVAIEPPPPRGHRVYAVVDGQPWLGSSTGDRLDISSLERGTHTLQAVLTDADGNVLARSQIINLYVKRPGDQVPDSPAGQATQAPKAPAAPGLPRPKKSGSGN